MRSQAVAKPSQRNKKLIVCFTEKLKFRNYPIETNGSPRLYETYRIGFRYSDELIEFAPGATVLLMECSFYKNKPVKAHLELTEAMEIARKCNPQKLVLSHLYSEWDGIDLAAEAKKLWPGETIEAFDGLRLEL